MGTVRVTVVVATDASLSKYGGISLAPEALYSMAEALNAGGIPMVWDHDPRHPVAAENVVARVEELDSGNLGVIAEFDVDEDAWAEIQQKFAEAGVPGGFSYTASTPIASIGDANASTRVRLAAEADHFLEEDVLAASEALAKHTAVHAETLFMFSAFDEIARVVIEFGPGVVHALAPELVGAALYDAVKALLFRKRRPGPTMVDFRVEESDGVRRVQAIVVTDDPDVAATAVRECFRRIDELTGIVEYDAESSAWLQRDE